MQPTPIEANSKLNLEEQCQRKEVIKSYPMTLYIEPFPACNLRCPFCPTANGWSEIKAEMLTPENFYSIVSKLRIDLLCHVNLFNWGEPFLNPHIFEYIRFFADHHVNTIVNTNFSTRDFDKVFCRSIIESGLRELFVSIDGATPQSYAKYRVGGSFERVLNNLRLLSQTKQELGAPLPNLYYKILLHRFNEHELESAQQLADECGAELVVHENFWIPEEYREEWQAKKVRSSYGDTPVTSVDMGGQKPIHTECCQLWDSILVNSNGDVYPCCIICKPKWRIGNLLEESFEEIWNGPKMRVLRRFATDANAPLPNFDNFCTQCNTRFCTHKLTLTKSQYCGD